MSSILDKIGSLKERLESRLGREFGNCRDCGKPTRSHAVRGGVQCHRCHTDRGRLVTDGGYESGNDGNETAKGPTPVRIPDDPQQPAPLSEMDRWILWNSMLQGDKPTKKPVAPYETDHMFPVAWKNYDEKDHGDPRTDLSTVERWVEDDPTATYRYRYPEESVTSQLGYAFVLAHTDEYPLDPNPVLIDFDDARDPETGEVHWFVDEFIDTAPTYCQYSNSGDVHAIGLGTLPEGVGSIATPLPEDERFPDAGIEVYDHDRFIAMTGDHIEGTPTEAKDITDTLSKWADRFEDEDKESETETEEGDPGQIETDTDVDIDVDPDHIPDDDTIQERLERAFANDHDGDRMENVYNGNFKAAGFSDRSSAEFWLANRLDSWVALGTKSVVRSLMNEANLKKWPERTDKSYRDSVLKEVGNQDWYYDPDYYDDDDGSYTVLTPHNIVADLASEQRRDFATERNSRPSTDQVRTKLRDAIFREMRNQNTTLLDAPTASGKTHTVASEPWARHASTTGEQPVIHVHETLEARDQAAAISDDADVDYKILQNRKEACETAAGEYDDAIQIDGIPASQWFDIMCDERGIPFSAAHAKAREKVDGELPCSRDGECDGPAQWHDTPRADDGTPSYDVIHCTHNFLFVPSLRGYTNIIVDEQPDFTVDLPQQRIENMVTSFLQAVDSPVQTWEELVTAADSPGPDTDIDGIIDSLYRDVPMEWIFADEDAHSLAADITEAVFLGLLNNEPDRNGLRKKRVTHTPPRFDVGGGDDHTDDDSDSIYGQSHLTVVIDDDYTIQRVRNKPDLATARSVIGLDAHPSRPNWALNVAEGITEDKILDPTERALWRRYERGLTIAQIGDATRPRSNTKHAEEWLNDHRVTRVVGSIKDDYGDDSLRTAITTAQVEDSIRDILTDVGCDDPETMHFGEERGRNDFAGEDVGYVYGCMDPGDDYVLNTLAELDLDATPETTVTDDGEEERERGRGFEGPDADTAAAVLGSVRENHVAQAAGRYARNADNDHQATVYVDTDALPERMTDITVPGVTWTATDLQREIIDTLKEHPGSSTRQLAADVGCSKEHVRQTLATLEERGAVDRAHADGEHGADLWEFLMEVGYYGIETGVELTANDEVYGTTRWTLAISEREWRTDSPTRPARPGSTAETAESITDRTGPPPD